MTLGQALAEATERLASHSDEARLETEVLLGHLLGITRTQLFARLQDAFPEDRWDAFDALLSRRQRGEPLAYIVGRREFYGLELAVDARVAIPRPETEALVEASLGLLRRHPQREPVVADVGTGSGAVAIALALHHPRARLYASDISAQALELARANAVARGVARRIRFLQGDLLAALPEPVDLVATNPPYVTTGELDRLESQGKLFEPRLALDGGTDGLAVLRRLLAQAPARLRPAGALLAEIGADQGKQAREAAQRRFPGSQVSVLPDLAGRDRLLVIQTSG